MIKKLSFRTFLLLFSMVLCIFLLMEVLVLAAPYDGDVFELMQPDNTYVKVKVWGDEFYQHVESLDGYTLCRDGKTGWICYAKLNSTASDFVTSGIVYNGTDFLQLIGYEQNVVHKSIKKGIKLDAKHVKAKTDAVRRSFATADVNESDSSAQFLPPDLAGAAPPPTVRGLTLLINFPDNTSSISKTEIENMINMPGYTGYSNNGSVRDYFYDVSGGNLNYTNYVAEFYTARYAKSYYNDPNVAVGIRAQELIKEALQSLEQRGFDFSSLTSDGGDVIALNCLYAGNPDVGWAQGLWPHAYYLTSPVSYDGVRLYRYQISNIGTSLSIGTFCHENGHMVCKWPDLYDYGSDSKGIGKFCIMSGSGGTNPAAPNPYLRNVISGWGTVTTLNNLSSQVTLQSNSINSYRYNGAASNEFFMVESLRKTGRYAGIPDEGLAIWHVDVNGSNDNQQMTSTSHYKVSLEQADGRFDMEYNRNSGDSTDLFDAGSYSQFNNTTTPNSKLWNGASSNLSISNISSVGTSMSCTIGSGSSTQTVATPSFNPPAGTYQSAQTVAISCATSGATIRYTLNGAEPTSSSAQYYGPITVSVSTTIKAKAFMTGMSDSITASAMYTIGGGGTTNTWAPNTPYAVGDVVTYNGSSYRCVIAHTSLVGWEPPNVPALWKLI